MADAGAVHKVDGVPAGEASGERRAEAGGGRGGGGGAQEGEEERGGRVVVGPDEGAEGEEQEKGLPGDKGTCEGGKRRGERGGARCCCCWRGGLGCHGGVAPGVVDSEIGANLQPHWRCDVFCLALLNVVKDIWRLGAVV